MGIHLIVLEILATGRFPKSLQCVHVFQKVAMGLNHRSNVKNAILEDNFKIPMFNKDNNIQNILHGGAKIWILSSNDENNILRMRVAKE